MIAPEPVAGPDYLRFCADEKTLLRDFVDAFSAIDPDIIIGWNVINFDLRLLQRKADEHGIALALGRARGRPDWRESRGEDEHYTLLIPGRLVLDGIDTLKSATYNFESFALDAVAMELLQRGKLSTDVDHRAEEITAQFLHDKPALAAYNLEDCQLVWDIFVHTRLLDFAVERARLTGLAMDRFGGSVAAFDNRYLPRLHRAGYIAPNIPLDPIGVGSPGGYVMDSIPGLYQHVLVLDFKSLYPSIIRTFKIDPLARIKGHQLEPHSPHWDRLETADVDRSQLVPGFNGAVFSKQHNLLPAIIDELWLARDEAKRQGNQAMSQAIKILMNSFYGVLGTPGCRFFDYRLPSSITLRGHDILTRSKALIEARGFQVIYGDTDSVFVWLRDLPEGSAAEAIDTIGRQLAAELNQWWQATLARDYQLQSHLEIQYETHYSRFVMPTIRDSGQGSKKRYAGVIETRDASGAIRETLVFKGLESVRTDWTPVARECQRELYRRIFAGEPWADYLRELVRAIRAGVHDDQLCYRKRLRRPLAEYTRNVPPHVQAARIADDYHQREGLPLRYQRGGWIRYVLTTQGPEPLEYRTAALDYDLYIERQIAPVADGILHFLDTSFAAVAGEQMGLF
jgi:DNA polymerase-2